MLQLHEKSKNLCFQIQDLVLLVFFLYHEHQKGFLFSFYVFILLVSLGPNSSVCKSSPMHSNPIFCARSSLLIPKCIFHSGHPTIFYRSIILKLAHLVPQVPIQLSQFIRPASISLELQINIQLLM